MICVHCEREFKPIPGKPRRVNECPICLVEIGYQLPCPVRKSVKPLADIATTVCLTSQAETAKIGSRCALCAEYINRGDRQVNVRGTYVRYHEDCHFKAMRI